MTSEVVVREALEKDLPQVLALYAQPGLDDGHTLTAEQATQHYRRFKEYPNYRLFVAELNGAIVGTFALLIMDNLAHLGAPSGVVEDVVVTAELRGKRIGRRMPSMNRSTSRSMATVSESCSTKSSDGDGCACCQAR